MLSSFNMHQNTHLLRIYSPFGLSRIFFVVVVVFGIQLDIHNIKLKAFYQKDKN